MDAKKLVTFLSAAALTLGGAAFGQEGGNTATTDKMSTGDATGPAPHGAGSPEDKNGKDQRSHKSKKKGKTGKSSKKAKSNKGGHGDGTHGTSSGPHDASGAATDSGMGGSPGSTTGGGPTGSGTPMTGATKDAPTSGNSSPAPTEQGK